MAARPLWVLTGDLPFPRAGASLVTEKGLNVLSLQSTQLQLPFKNEQWAQGQHCFSSSAVRYRLLCFPFHEEHGSIPGIRALHLPPGLWEVGSGHSASSPSPWTIGTALKGRVGFFLLLVHLHKGQDFELEIFWLLNFWTGQRSDSCDSLLEKKSYIKNKFGGFFVFVFVFHIQLFSVAATGPWPAPSLFYAEGCAWFSRISLIFYIFKHKTWKALRHYI